MPAGAVGEIAKVEILPPVELTVKPVETVFTVAISEDDERVKAGAATVAGNSAVITPELALFETDVAPTTVKKLALIPVKV
jgi:hypothetical protein